MEIPAGLIATRYQIRRQWNGLADPRTTTLPVEFVRMNSPFYTGERWAVRRGAWCLSLAGEWEHEPLPSSRDDEFYARCRFTTLRQAHKTYLGTVEE